MSYAVRREHEQSVIRAILSDPEILDAIAEDGEHGLPEFDTEADCFLSLIHRGNVVGLYILHPMNRLELDIHAHVLPKYRKQHARPLTKMVLQWILDNTGYTKVTAQVPVIHPNVMAFCSECGMKEEGVNRASWLKNGKVHDQQRYGFTADEIKEFLEKA